MAAAAGFRDRLRPGHRSGYAGRRACLLPGRGTGRAAAPRPGASQSGCECRGAHRGRPATHAARGRGDAGQPGNAPPDHRGRPSRTARRTGRRPGRAPAGHRLRRAGPQCVSGGQPVHGGRRPCRAAAGRDRVRQRAAAGDLRVQEHQGCQRHHREGVHATADLPQAAHVAVRLQRAAGHLGRQPGPTGRHGRGLRALPAVEDRHGPRGAARESGDADPWGLHASNAHGPDPAFRGVRAGGATDRQEGGGLPSVPRGGARRADHRGGQPSGRGPPGRRGVAHPGQRQEPDHGVLRREAGGAAGTEQSHRWWS